MQLTHVTHLSRFGSVDHGINDNVCALTSAENWQVYSFGSKCVPDIQKANIESNAH